jgi:hypothetical protein
MLKAIVIAAGMALFATSAYAVECTTAEIDKLDSQIKTLTDKTTQDNATKELQSARDMMAKNDMTGCQTHLDAAGKASGVVK